MSVAENSEELSPIDPRVVRGLNKVFTDSSKLGFELFVFGSVAETYPWARKGADLDLGIMAKNTMRPELKRDQMRQISRRLADLPTIRPVDLIDFDTVDPDFKAIALRSQLHFPLVEYGTRDKKSS
ncbi:MAG: hypothetical protein JJT75_12655 [Opitutales bacterium]|nr:hypothetical protein [Opitutales bacterium]MCH8539597.1 hypothetical protein [Opitutales bacterium]